MLLQQNQQLEQQLLKYEQQLQEAKQQQLQEAKQQLLHERAASEAGQSAKLAWLQDAIHDQEQEEQRALQQQREQEEQQEAQQLQEQLQALQLEQQMDELRRAEERAEQLAELRRLEQLTRRATTPHSDQLAALRQQLQQLQDQKQMQQQRELQRLQQLQQLRTAVQQREQELAALRERELALQQLGTKTSPAAAAPRAAVLGSTAADEDVISAQLANQLRQLRYPNPALAVPASQLGGLNNSNVAKLQPAANAAARALLDQEAAAGALGLGALPAGEVGGWAGAGGGLAGLTSSAEADTIDEVNRLGHTYRAGGGCTGAYGLVGKPSPTMPFSPQSYILGSRQGLQTGTLLLDPSGGTRVELSNLGQTADPAKLAKAMPNSQVFNAAQKRCMRAMVKPGYITLETIPKWEVFVCAWERLAEVFGQRDNWGGFLAANHKAWVAMWERGLPPDTDAGRIDMLEVLPHLNWQPHAGGPGGGVGGGGQGGSSSGNGRPGQGGSGGGGPSAEPCRLFRDGKCRYGDKCHYKH
jgi:chemotaxis protein histidine kinase CheA